ncbi:phospholipase D-like domain-containing protein [Alicyclobacillus herbarius]|uniref:phospholipase D-like domain-containing protein n=1 Tax=Alicyclobacillus herbarius TaxID=122960 RepID=UPI000412E026|nr:phospholipase D-like domain-containing protein [Alicyclobacillus herbarius]
MLLFVILLYVVNTVCLMGIALRDATRPQRALNWLAVGLILPILGPLLYVALSWPARIRRRSKSDASPADPKADLTGVEAPAEELHAALWRITGEPPRHAHVRILTNGPEKYEALVDALRAARRRIDMEYYIYRADHVGQLITAILCDRARAGVKVRFIRDGIGSRQLPKATLAEMLAAGIECRTVFPLRFPWLSRRLNYRDHCKIAIVDDEIAFVGGINVGDEYTGLKPGVGHWRDTHLCLSGDGVSALARVFNMNWAIATPDEPFHRKAPQTESANAESSQDLDPNSTSESGKVLSRLRTRSIRRARPALAVEFAHLDSPGWDADASRQSSDHNEEKTPDTHGSSPAARAFAGQSVPAAVQLIQSGPDSPAQSQRELFFLSITLAKRQVEITTPYFATDPDLTMAMKTAVARGVTVRLLVPKHPDHRLVDLASQTYYGDLLKAGVQVFQYEPGVLHAKVMTVDDNVGIVGAANYDPRSFRMNFEVSEVIYSREVTEQLREQFHRDLESSTQLSLDELADRPLWRRGLDRAARLFAPQL